MKFYSTTPQEHEVTHLVAVMGPRYWEDASVNGVEEDNDAPKMPFIYGDRWTIMVDLDTGTIKGWPKGTTAKTHYKVCDDGLYKLVNSNGNAIASKDGYVPSMLCPNTNGYGDYVILKIDEDGHIEGWSPDLSYFSDDD